LVVALYSEEEW